jgi:hypothetical protein
MNVVRNFDLPDHYFNVGWIGDPNDEEGTFLEVTSREQVQWFKVVRQDGFDYQGVWERTGNETVLKCRPTLAKLVLDISYVEGTRRITHVTENAQNFKPETIFRYIRSLEGFKNRFNDPKFDLWFAEVKEGIRIWNILALLDAAMRAFEFTCKEKIGIEPPYQDGEIHRYPSYCLEKGELQAVSFWWIGVLTIVVELPFTNMFLSDKQRRNDPDSTTPIGIQTKELNITETTINEYLVMAAISALSLNAGETPVPVNITTYQATYEFSNPFNLILPYSLSLFFCAIFVGIGIWSWAHNGASAADGGFLQIMTTTTGRTRMEDLAIAQRIDKDNLPEELLDLEVRYGELLDAHGVGTGVAGFGTVEETKLLRKGWCPS